MHQDTVFIVENEMEIIQLLRLHLTNAGFRVIWTTDSTKALSMAQEEKPDLILLDVVMPGYSGHEVCNQIRSLMDIPILFVSCKNMEIDKIIGLSIGGDDYITKPFSPAEVVARVKAHLRRKKGRETEDERLPNSIAYGGLHIDLLAHSVTIDAAPVHLTAKEFELLSLLARYPNRVFTPRQIFDQLWTSCGEEEDVRTVSVHISNLRKKIESNSENPLFITTVRGVGYKFSGKAK